MGKLYVYAMTNDSGFAPCVKDGLLSLVCCKGGKNGGMRTAIYKDFNDVQQKGEDVWILGVCGKGMASGNITLEYMPVYLARVTSVIDMNEYFTNSAYAGRSDCVYAVENGALKSMPNNPHSVLPSMVENDICGKYAVLSTNFVYFGSECGRLGREIKQKYPQLFSSQGEKAGIDTHYRGYMVDRDFAGNIAEDFKDCDWFPEDGGYKILSDRGLSSSWMYDADEETEDEACVSVCGRIQKDNKAQMNICPQCGKANYVEASFCIACGTKLQLITNTDEQNNNGEAAFMQKVDDMQRTHEKPNNKKTKKLLKVLIIVACAVVAACIILGILFYPYFRFNVGTVESNLYAEGYYGKQINHKEFELSYSEFEEAFLQSFKENMTTGSVAYEVTDFEFISSSNGVKHYRLSSTPYLDLYVNAKTNNILMIDVDYLTLDMDGSGAARKDMQRALAAALNGNINWSAFERDATITGGFLQYKNGVLITFENENEYTKHITIMPASEEMYEAINNDEIETLIKV